MTSWNMRSKYLLLTIALALVVVLPASIVFAAGDNPPLPPIGRPIVAASVYGTDQAPPPPSNGITPSVPQPGVLDPMDIYNNLLIPDKLPEQSKEAKVAGTEIWAGATIATTVTDLANGTTLSYPNGRRPVPCIDFNDKGKWASQIVANGVRQGKPWDDHYAGWASGTLNKGLYSSQFVAFSFEETVANEISAKITSNQPYAAWYGSPLIPVTPGDEIRVIARYLLANQPPERAYDWASLGIKPDAIPFAQNAVYANGYVHGMWAALEQTVIANGDNIMVLLQGQSPAAINSNVYFDDVEVFVNGNALKDCELEESFSKN